MKKRLIHIIGLMLILTSCSLHKIDIQQGNVLEADDIAQLKVGMTIKQVRFILGSPSIRDPFHRNRWDYVYLFQSGLKGSEPQRQHLTLYFDGDLLSKIDPHEPAPPTDKPGDH